MKPMFTEVNDKIYLNNDSMTVLMADTIRAYICPQEYILTTPTLNQKHAETIVEPFKETWSRPQDDSNSELHDMYRSVPEGIQWAADRELERRDAALATEADKVIYRRFLDAVLGEEDGNQ